VFHRGVEMGFVRFGVCESYNASMNENGTSGLQEFAESSTGLVARAWSDLVNRMCIVGAIPVQPQRRHLSHHSPYVLFSLIPNTQS
jgi:hypothetical protein